MYWSRTITVVGIVMAAASAAAQPTMPRDRVPAVPQSLRGFVDRLYSADPVERAEAACQIGRRHREAAPAISILLTMLQDDALVRRIECGNEWMRRHADLSPDAVKWTETSPAKEAAEALGDIGDAAVPGLIRELQHAEWRVRKFAAYGLGEADPKLDRVEAVTALTDRLNDAHVEVRDQSAWALGEIEHASAVPALVAMLKDPDLEIRKRSAWALGEIESRRAVQPLIQALKDPSFEVRKMAAWALGEIEDVTALEPLQAARYDVNVEVREAVVRAIRELRDR